MIFVNCDNCFENIVVKIIDYKVKIIIFCHIRNSCFVNIVVEHRIGNLTTCVYSKIYFYLLEKSYPQTREIANFGKI